MVPDFIVSTLDDVSVSTEQGKAQTTESVKFAITFFFSLYYLCNFREISCSLETLCLDLDKGLFKKQRK
jgi:hypothetical protein